MTRSNSRLVLIIHLCLTHLLGAKPWKHRNWTTSLCLLTKPSRAEPSRAAFHSFLILPQADHHHRLHQWSRRRRYTSLWIPSLSSLSIPSLPFLFLNWNSSLFLYFSSHFLTNETGKKECSWTLTWSKSHLLQLRLFLALTLNSQKTNRFL